MNKTEHEHRLSPQAQDELLSLIYSLEEFEDEDPTVLERQILALARKLDRKRNGK